MVIDTDDPSEIICRLDEFAQNIDARSISINDGTTITFSTKQPPILPTDLEES